MGNYENQNILILGTGFLGQNIALKFAELGFTVTLFGRTHPKFLKVLIARSPGIQFVRGDFLNIDDLRSVLQPQQTIFHCISSTNPRTDLSPALKGVRTDIQGSILLLTLLKKHRQVRLVFLSTGGAIYGNAPHPSETTPPNPSTPYAVGKIAIEDYIKYYCKMMEVPFQILRIANPYGQFQDPERGLGAITAFIAAALKKNPLIVLGSKENQRDYIHIQDLTEIIFQVFLSRHWNDVINIGTGQSNSLASIIRCIEAILGRTLPLTQLPPREGEVLMSSLDTEKLMKIIGPFPFTSLEQGIYKYYQFMKEHRPFFT